MKKALYGVGVNDVDYCVYSCPYYKKWHGMLSRAYSSKYHKRRPTYNSVVVCQDWHVFSVFRSWMILQDWEGKELDKDILYPGNKCYSPETCCFVNKEINLLFKNFTLSENRTFPVGVSKNGRKFQARLRVHNKRKSLGSFLTIEEAHWVYIAAKIVYIENFYPIVEERIKEGLMRHVINLTKELT